MTDFEPTFIITGEQIRGARAMLRLDQKQFAALIHLTVGAVRRMERTPGPIVSAQGVAQAVRIALDNAGIELIQAGSYEGVGGPGVRLRRQSVVADDVIDFEEADAELPVTDEAIPDAS